MLLQGRFCQKILVFWCWNVVFQLSVALQPFMAWWQGLAWLSPVLGLTLAGDTGPDPPESIHWHKKLRDLMSFQFIRNIKKLFFFHLEEGLKKWLSL